MFNLINIGERVGSGVPNIFNVWADEGWEEPIIEERFDPDRRVLSLSLKKKVTEKTQAIIGCSDIVKVTGDSLMAAGRIIAKMKEQGLPEAVSGHGKGKYRFKI